MDLKRMEIERTPQQYFCNDFFMILYYCYYSCWLSLNWVRAFAQTNIEKKKILSNHICIDCTQFTFYLFYYITLTARIYLNEKMH